VKVSKKDVLQEGISALPEEEKSTSIFSTQCSASKEILFKCKVTWDFGLFSVFC